MGEIGDTQDAEAARRAKVNKKGYTRFLGWISDVYECTKCGALIGIFSILKHNKWHRDLEEKLKKEGS